jgi:penicillin-insensitive murein DD-endopeptidase
MTRYPVPFSQWSPRCLKGLRAALLCAALCLLLGAENGAVAQDESRPTPRAVSRIAHPDDSKTHAKERKTQSTKQEARSIGFYSAGCLAGGAALPISGPAWRVMPLSRNRNWGHPTLIRFLENLALEVRKAGIWNGLLIGDMSQLHGGQMSSGHASHQIGLDADIWLRPMPNGEPTGDEREEMMSTNVVAHDRLDVDPTRWMPRHGALIKAAALNAQVERIFVNPAIKKALCRETTGDRKWLHKVRPWWGHDYHFHVRLRCPAGSAECKPQDPPPPGDGCDKDLDWWFTDEGLYPKPGPEKPLTTADLPPACRPALVRP